MLPENTHLASATLVVRDLALASGFYSDVIGLDIIDQKDQHVVLGDQQSPLLYLEENKELPFPSPNQAGLYHLAFLFSHPSRLAQAIERIGQLSPALYQGSSDHLVSEAFYLSDPEGNGIELYVDRPREQWEHKNGQIVMGSLPLDPAAFHQRHSQANPEGSVSLGHVHLKIGDTGKAREFYGQIIGFDTVFEMPTALFVSAGGYHHHLGLNTWESQGAGHRSPSLGLKQFDINISQPEALAEIKKRLTKSKFQVNHEDQSVVTDDPWGITLRLFA